MANFSNLIITEAGKGVLNDELLSEQVVTYTRIALSSHKYMENELESLTRLEEIEQSETVGKVVKENDNTIVADAIFNNNELQTGFYIRAVGLYAKLGNKEEMLFAVSVEKENASYMPKNTETLTSVQIKLRIKIDNTDNISFFINESGMATVKELLEVENKLDTHTSDKTAHITKGHVTGKLTADVLGTSNHIVSVNNSILVMDSANDITELENIEDAYNGLVDFRYSHKGPIALQLPAIWLQDETTEVQLTVTVLSRNANARFDFYIGFTVHMEQEAGSSDYRCAYDHFTAYSNSDNKSASYLSELPITYGSIKSPSSPIPLIWIGESDISKLTDWGLGTVAYVHDILVNTPETGIGMSSEWNKSFKILNAYGLMQTLGDQAGELMDTVASIRNTNASPGEDSYIKVVRDFSTYPGMEHDMLKNTFFAGNIDQSEETGYIDYSHVYIGNPEAVLTLESAGNDFIQFAFRGYDPHRSSIFFRSGHRGSTDNKNRWRSLDKVNPFILFDGSANVINLSSDSLQWTHSFNVPHNEINKFDIMREYIIQYGDELVETHDYFHPDDENARAFDFGKRFGLHFKILMDVYSNHPSYDSASYYLQTTDFDLIMQRNCGGYYGTKLLDIMDGYGSHRTMEFNLKIYVFNSEVTSFDVTIGAPYNTGSQFYSEFGNILAYLEYLAIVQDR